MTKGDVLQLSVCQKFGDEDVLSWGFFYISVDEFLERFEDAELSASSLKSHPNATPAWKQTFDQWESQGVIPS